MTIKILFLVATLIIIGIFGGFKLLEVAWIQFCLRRNYRKLNKIMNSIPSKDGLPVSIQKEMEILEFAVEKECREIGKIINRN